MSVFILSEFVEKTQVPFVSMQDQLETAFSTLKVQGMKTIEHEDTEFNNDYSVDPLADPRLDRMDLFNMVDSSDRDAVMNASGSFVGEPADSVDFEAVSASSIDSSSESGSGE